MSQQSLSIVNLSILPTEESIFTPGRVWSNNTGKIYDVEEPDA